MIIWKGTAQCSQQQISSRKFPRCILVSSLYSTKPLEQCAFQDAGWVRNIALIGHDLLKVGETQRELRKTAREIHVPHIDQD